MSPLAFPRLSRERSHRCGLNGPGDSVGAEGGVRVRPRSASTRASGAVAPQARPSLSVLLAGGDAYRRAILRAELATTLPRMTRFREADEVAQVLEHAPHSRLVVLAGDLRDGETEPLMRLLGQRHPELAVVCLNDEPVRVGVGADG